MLCPQNKAAHKICVPFLKNPAQSSKKSLIVDGGVLFESEILGNKALREIPWQNNTNNTFLCIALGICGFF